MSQNRSTAVMQRRAEPHDSLDDFPTPPWATRALVEQLVARGWVTPGRMTVREPAANRGFMVRPLAESFGVVFASDIFDYGAGFAQADYLFGPLPDHTDWTITNPPFRLAQQFIERAIACSDGVAVIVRSAFLEGVARHAELFSVRPPALVLQFAERVPMVKGRCDGEATTATSYAWLVWRSWGHVRGETHFDWIPPCRKRLERAGDYSPLIVAEAA